MTKSYRGAIRNGTKERFAIPKSVQKCIPIKEIYRDGTFNIGNGYSKTYRFADINYRVVGLDEQKGMMMSYCALLNSLDSASSFKITINNRKINKAEFEKNMLLQQQDDRFNPLRRAYNRIMTENAIINNNSIAQEKYVTISVNKDNIDEANMYFSRISTDLRAQFARLDSNLTELDVREKLRILHDFYRAGEEDYFRFDFDEAKRKGQDFADYICPDYIGYRTDHILLGDRFARVLFLSDYASYIEDDFITTLCEYPKNLMLSIDIVAAPAGEAIKYVENKMLSIETNNARHQQKQIQQNNFTGITPMQIEQQRHETQNIYQAITSDNQRMFYGYITLVHTADTLEELNDDTEAILSIGSKNTCRFNILKYQQKQALDTVLPIGHRKTYTMRTLLTKSAAILFPFSAQEIFERKGLYYGVNSVSRNFILCDRKSLQNGNGFITGVSGSGKSVSAKVEMLSLLIQNKGDVICIDPEAEYYPLAKALDGEVIRISANSDTHINAMDINSEYGGGDDPIKLKSEFVLSLCEQLVGVGKLDAKQKSIIDRCVDRVYKKARKDKTKPTLKEFYNELLVQPEQEAKDIALSIELYVNGSLSTFAQPTNVNTSKQFVIYDTKDLGSQLKTAGMLVVLDSIWSRITANRKKGRNTWIYIDECHLLFQHEFSMTYLMSLWKRVRKYGAFMTGITQNIEEIVRHDAAKLMFANSEFVIFHNQSATDRMRISELMNISSAQQAYLTNASQGHGLIKVGNSIVPFENRFPAESEIYKLVTTKPGERTWEY